MWADIFGNALIALAIADRLCYRCHLIRITGSSYRIKDLPAASLSQRRAQAPILADPIAPAGADILPKSVSLGLTLTMCPLPYVLSTVPRYVYLTGSAL